MITHTMTPRPATWTDYVHLSAPRSDSRGPHDAHLYARNPDHPRRASLLGIPVTIVEGAAHEE
jgi:hypothetical protein